MLCSSTPSPLSTMASYSWRGNSAEQSWGDMELQKQWVHIRLRDNSVAVVLQTTSSPLFLLILSFTVNSARLLQKAIRQTEESSGCVREVQCLCKLICHILQLSGILGTSFSSTRRKKFLSLLSPCNLSWRESIYLKSKLQKARNLLRKF